MKFFSKCLIVKLNTLLHYLFIYYNYKCKRMKLSKKVVLQNIFVMFIKEFKKYIEF